MTLAEEWVTEDELAHEQQQTAELEQLAAQMRGQVGVPLKGHCSAGARLRMFIDAWLVRRTCVNTTAKANLAGGMSANELFDMLEGFMELEDEEEHVADKADRIYEVCTRPLPAAAPRRLCRSWSASPTVVACAVRPAWLAIVPAH